MRTRLPCPYLGADVEFNVERERHIAEGHPDLLPKHRERIAETLADPDMVRRSARFSNARLISRWYSGIRGGKHIVAVVMSEPGRKPRHWIITAYMARKLAEGETEWKRN